MCDDDKVVFGDVAHWAEYQLLGQWCRYLDSKYLCAEGIVAADAHVLVKQWLAGHKSW